MWDGNSNISITFGNAIHYTMEQFFKHRENGCDEKEYHLPKHPFLRGVIDSFPDKNENIIPELVVSCLKHKMAGRIDGLKFPEGLEEKYVVPIDYKTDADIEKNLDYHTQQLSFYAFMLEQFGFKVPYVEVYNYTDSWTLYERDVVEYDPNAKVEKKKAKKKPRVKETWLKESKDDNF